MTMPSKKTGIYISAINEPIVTQVMNDFGYTKISNALNFIIQEYSRLTKEQSKQPPVVVQEVEQPKADLSSWFVVEDK